MACDICLRRAHLVALLSPWIAGLLDRPRRRPRALLSLSDSELIAAVRAGGDHGAERFLERFEPRFARNELERASVAALCGHEDGYPSGLRDLSDAPAALFIA